MHDWQAAVRDHLIARRVDPARHTTVIEELTQHLDDRYRSLVARGMSAADAERSVLQELDESAALRDELARAERRLVDRPAPGDPGGRLLHGVWQDVRYAARALAWSPGFTAVAALTLALGVGANSAIFSIINAVMLRPLPYAHPERLIRIYESNPERGWPQFSASHPNFLDWRTQARSWVALAATSSGTVSMTSNDGAEVLREVLVTADFLPALGVLPAIGRNFTADEDRPGGGTRVVILTDGFWRRAFGGDPGAVGRIVQLNNLPYTIVGILPPSFQWGANLEVLLPLAPDPARPRGDHRLSVIGLLKPGVSLTDARTELTGIARRLAQQYPADNQGWGVSLITFRDWMIGAGLLLRSFVSLQQVHPGFAVDGLMTGRVMLTSRTAFDTPEKRVSFWRQLSADVRALPGVTAFATGSGVPLTSGNTSTEIEIPGETLPPDARPSADWRIVTPGYFQAMGIPLRGRDFTEADDANAPPTVIISEALARRWRGATSPAAIRSAPRSRR